MHRSMQSVLVYFPWCILQGEGQASVVDVVSTSTQTEGPAALPYGASNNQHLDLETVLTKCLAPLLVEMKLCSKNTSAMCGEYQNHVTTLATSLEYELAEGIKKFLDDGHIIAVNRKFDGCPGDMDCVVAGMLDGEPVVIIGEAKTNMPQKHVEARKTLSANKHYWLELCGWDGVLTEDCGFNKYHQKDYEALQIASHRETRVIYAVGGAVFPHNLDKFFDKTFKGQGTWLRMHLNGGNVVAVCEKKGRL